MERGWGDLATFRFTLPEEIRARADRACHRLDARARACLRRWHRPRGGLAPDGSRTDTYSCRPQHHGRRFAVTCLVTQRQQQNRVPIQGGSSFPIPPKKNKYVISPLEIIHTQKTLSGARHLPETDRFLGGFSLLVQIEEKSPEGCVDA